MWLHFEYVYLVIVLVTARKSVACHLSICAICWYIGNSLPLEIFVTLV